MVQFQGSYFVLGGYYRPRMIAKIEDCGIREQAEQLPVPHINGMYGSCTVYEEAVQLCFYGETQKGCASFTPESGSIPLDGRTRESHDFAGMITFNVRYFAIIR